MEWTAIIGYCFSLITAAGGWAVGRRKYKNDFLNDLQKSINLLAEENNKLLAELLEVKKTNIQLKMEIEHLRNENKMLRDEVKKIIQTN